MEVVESGTSQASARCGFPGTPPGRGQRSSQDNRRRSRLRCDASQSNPDCFEFGNSLVHAASSMETAAEVGTDGSDSDVPPSQLDSSWSQLSPGWSPANNEAGSSSPSQGQHSKRRSTSDLSDSARMTPKALQNRGLGIPWQRVPGLCTLKFAVDDSALQICLVPTPELDGAKADAARQPAPEAELGSPSAMQRRFLDRVNRASLGNDDDDEGPDDMVNIQGCAQASCPVMENSSRLDVSVGVLAPVLQIPRDVHPSTGSRWKIEEQGRAASPLTSACSSLRVRPQIQKVIKENRRPVNTTTLPLSSERTVFPALLQYQLHCERKP